MSENKEKAAVRVNSLHWGRGDYVYARLAPMPFGYCIGKEDGKFWLTIDGVQDQIHTPFKSENEAKSAAQADYERRILSAIEVTE